MEPIKYYYESNDNQSREEDKQGYALIMPLSAAQGDKISDHILGESLKTGRKPNVQMGKKTLEINIKHCPKAFNVEDPFTGEIIPEITIVKLYNEPQFKDLYEELSKAVGDISQLKAGVKKK